MRRQWIGLLAAGLAIDVLATLGYVWWQHRRHRTIIGIRPAR